MAASKVAPTAHDELRALLRLAAPAFVSTISFFALTMLEMIFAGHLGTAEMTAVAFSQIVFDFTIIVFTQGFNKGLNALGSQAFGAKNLLLLGRYAQMGCLGVTVVTLPLAFSWWFVGDLLRLFGVSPASVVLAQQYSKLSTLWLWPRLIYQYLTVYFNSQQIVLPTAIVSVSFVVVHVGMNVLVVFGVPSWGWAGLGFAGLPIVMCITMYGRLGVYLLYMMWYRQHHAKSWVWNLEFCQAKYIIPQVRVGLPLAVGQVFENSQLQTMALLASSMGEVSLDSHNSMIVLVFFLTSPIYGLGSAGVIRIGMYLGANEPEKAHQLARLLATCICCISVGIATVLMINRNVVGHLYSEDPRVWASMTSICTLAASGYVILSVFYSSMVQSVPFVASMMESAM
ncbi:hypothetical protein H257_16533 [Aphanomyces astaci]|uniref:MATE efflux family protein n=1 Tax=Aphanomyces astaci TaxID=112090 RepID=W4FKD4_APHAT|nr:hypothetical protein H257_16533 [Aphanomyces astaci]ETV67299.1 hypothetical protein H257_16533 [Aphanomyces astaci]|eukprot:XP_009843287.1 hypothetical protein H257_16533 [Aphanomyces astaci]